MVQRIDRTYVDAEGVTIHFHVWPAARAGKHAAGVVPANAVPAGAPKGILQIEHGLGEYAARYGDLAQAAAEAGFTVYADDHRGHGQTGMQQYSNDATQLGRLGQGGLTATIAAIRQLTTLIRTENPGVPLAILGHSWGSLMVQKILDHHAGDYDAAILTGTAHRKPGSMNSGQLNAKHKHLGTTGYEWLSRDPAVSQAFLDDPLAFTADVLKLFGVADGLRLFGVPTKHIEKDLPLLIAIGGDDSLGGEKSVRNLANAYLKRSRLTDVQVVVYEGARHEIFHELNSDAVVADIIAWLRERLDTAAPGMSAPGAAAAGTY